MTHASKNVLVDDTVFTVDHFVTDAECRDLISLSESIGYDVAPVNTAAGQEVIPDWRNNRRVMVDDHQLADWLWERARQFAPQTLDGWHAVGINERIRFYRYHPGQQFDWHHDGSFQRENGERSFLTFMIYLNEVAGGGETRFAFDGRPPRFEDFAVTPATGLALFFIHRLLHKGEAVSAGCKYVLRSDIMYAR